MSSPATEIYTQSDFENNYPDGMERHYWTLARNRILATAIRKTLRDPGMILDVGCGRGFTVQYLSACGYDCRGVERGVARPVDGADDRIFTETNFSDLPLALRRDVRTLLFLDVLEHVATPVELLDEARELFPQARSVVITVPARQELWSNYDEAFGHYLRYSADGLTRLLAEARVTPLHLRYFFHSLYLPMRLLHLLNRPRSTKYATPEPAALHRMMAGLFYLETVLLPRRLPGSSLCAVGRL